MSRLFRQVRVSAIGGVSQWEVEYLGRIDAEGLEGVDGDEDVSHVSVDLQLVVPPLQVADDGLLRGGSREDRRPRQSELRPADRSRV